MTQSPRGGPRRSIKAIEEYKLALNADPEFGGAEQRACRSLFPRRQRARCRGDGARAAEELARRIDAHKLLGRIYLRQLGEARKRRASTRLPDNVLDQAIAEFEKIVALQPKSVEDHMVLGQLYTVKHQPEKAEESSRRRKRSSPSQKKWC